jgi:Holliday junction resolvase RusA-like endonuclease
LNELAATIDGTDQLTLEVLFTVPGEPRGKGRPRFTRKGFAYTDTATRDYETVIRCRAAEAMPCEALDTPISVRVDIYKGVAKSWSNARRSRALDGLEIPGKPDLDNVAKAVLDAMNGVVYADDAQVVRLLVTKQYSLEPRLVVTVKEAID